MTKLTFILLLGILISCSESETCGINIPVANNKDCDSPVIDTIGQMSTAYYFKNISKGIESDTVFSNPATKQELSFYVNNTIVTCQKYRTPYIMAPQMIDSLGNVIWEYVPPYDSIQMISCFILNCSSKNQQIQISDGKLIAIQEALGKDNKWAPIECFEFSGCGNSHSDIAVSPGDFLEVPIYKYLGELETKLRLKIQSNGHIYYSNEYSGKINAKQLLKRELDFGESYLGNKNGY
jgi:hypothetical protein